MTKVSDLNREQKIELIQKLQERRVHVIDGNIIELSPVVIVKQNGKFEMNSSELTSEQLDELLAMFPPDQGIIFLPEKRDPEDEKEFTSEC